MDDQVRHVLPVLDEDVAVEAELLLVPGDDLDAGLLVVDVVLLQRLDEGLYRVARDQPEEEERDRQRAPQLDQVQPETADRVARQGMRRQPGSWSTAGRVPARGL